MKRFDIMIAVIRPMFATATPLAIGFWLLGAAAGAAPAAESLIYQFGQRSSVDHRIGVLPEDHYSSGKGYGFEPGGRVQVSASGSGNETSCIASAPFYFSIALPEGNYRVTAVLGDPAGVSTNTIKAEMRRLMTEHVVTARGQFATQTFVVNVRTPAIPGGRVVRLKERERTNEMVAWDEKLTLEFNGSRPALRTLEVSPAPDLPTVFLMGDSTVCDQPTEPWNSWGQMLPRFFKPTVAIANHAQSGESLKSSLSARRLEKVAGSLRNGDYLLIQFGHNDMKDPATNALAQYRSHLKQFVSTAREKGATPVLITSMERKAGVVHDTLQEYPAAVRAVAAEEGVALIDLHAMSRQLYQALGENLDAAFQDGTHHNNFGSHQLAKCVVQAIRHSPLELRNHIRDDFTGFDPEKPDSPPVFSIPPSPGALGERPLGD